MGELRAADGTALHWRAWPAEDGERVGVVGLLHGGAEHGERYPELVAALNGAGFDVYALDLRGHGRSGGTPGHVNRFAEFEDDLGRFFDVVREESGEGRPFVLGYSLGGVIGAEYALNHQAGLAGLVMVGPALGVGAGVSPLQFRAARAMSAVAPRLPLLKMHPESMMSDPAAVEAYRADPLVYHGRFDARMLAELASVMLSFPEEIHELQIPLLVLHGDADVTADPSGSEVAVERAGTEDKTLIRYDGMRHDLFNEPGRERVHADLAGWLEARVQAAPDAKQRSRRW